MTDKTGTKSWISFNTKKQLILIKGNNKVVIFKSQNSDIKPTKTKKKKKSHLYHNKKKLNWSVKLTKH